MIREGSDPEGTFLLLAVKAVPGAKRDEIAGVLGEGDSARLKVRVSAPPEGGKANRAICRLVAEALDVKPAAVQVARGHASPEKTLRIRGVATHDARTRLIAGK
jgi:uncharacterized protein (TIGR00251 family)